MNIEILEGEVNKYKESVSVTVLAFGNVKENSVAEVKVEIQDVETSSIAGTCGCQAITSTEKNTFSLRYLNTSILEPFSKIFILDYLKDGNHTQEQIKITGNVIK